MPNLIILLIIPEGLPVLIKRYLGIGRPKDLINLYPWSAALSRFGKTIFPVAASIPFGRGYFLKPNRFPEESEVGEFGLFVNIPP